MIANSFTPQNYDLTSLYLALNKLFDKQEKDWGYFQIKKGEDELYRLCIPALPTLKFYQNPNNQIYKAFWGASKKPAVSIRKKQRKVQDPQQPRLVKKQRVLEVIYQYDPDTEITWINTIIANLIREKITATLSYTPEDEIMPLVLISQEV